MSTSGEFRRALTMQGYIRDGELFVDNPSAKLGL